MLISSIQVMPLVEDKPYGVGFASLKVLTHISRVQCISYFDHFWCGDSPLKEAFPELFLISQDRDSSIADLLQLG